MADARWCLLPLLGLSSCLVPGLEVGPGQGGTGGAATSVAGTGGVVGGASAGDATSVAGGGASGQSVGGSGGSEMGGQAGGGTVEVRCEDFPIMPKSTWMVAASYSSLTGAEGDPLYNPPSHAIDDDPTDRWASGTAQRDDLWFHVDFGAPVAVSEVTLEQGVNLDDYPRGYSISLSSRHTDFDAPSSATGQGAAASESVIPLDHRAVGRYMLIKQTGTATKWWSIAEINVACH